MTANIKNISIALFFLAATVGVILGIWNGRILAHSVEKAAGNVESMSGEAKDWFAAEHERASSPKNQASLDAAIQLGAVWNATGREMNTQVLPRLWRLLDTTKDTTAKVGQVADQSRETIKQEGESFGAVLASAKGTLDGLSVASGKLGVDLDTLGQAISETSRTANLGVSEITRRVADNRFDAILDQALSLTTEAAATVGNVETASEQLPEIAADLEKISKTTSRFTKAYWVARILSIVVPLVP